MLTIKQERFVLEYMKDGNASRAYRESYNAENMKPESINRKAKELIDNVKIKARIAELREKQTKKAIISIEQRKELLTKFAFEEDASNAMKALEILNKMDGVYIVKQQTELTGSVAVQKIERVIIDSSDSNA
jgi:phage terminase small subunit